ncbi:MAG: hypothetical protein R3A44_17625 [Caldilineaceae bacterium]
MQLDPNWAGRAQSCLDGGRKAISLLRLFHSKLRIWAVLMLIGLASAGCGFGGGQPTPTVTPFATWTATPNTGGAPAQPAANAQPVQQPPANNNPLAVAAQPPAPPTPTSLPPTNTPIPTDTPIPSPTPLPTDTPTATAPPTATATPNFAFELEAAEKFPTDSLAANVVRVYLYVYSATEFGLPGYTLAVSHNGAPVNVDVTSQAGLPEQTRAEPGPYTRFTNMNMIFVEPQAGSWEIQLIDVRGAIMGPPVRFDLTADENTREIYVRYRRK